MHVRDNNPRSEDYQSNFNKAIGKNLMDSLRDQLFQMNVISEVGRERREETSRDISILTLYIVIGGSIVLGVGFGLYARSNLRSVSQDYEAVLRSEQKNAELISTTLLSIGDAVLVTDAKGCINQINAVAEQLTGWKNAEAIGKPSTEVFNIVNESTREPVESPVDRVIREGVIVGLANHTVLIHRNGSEIPIDDSGAPIRNADGNLIGTVLVFRDITERKLYEQQLAETYDKDHRIADSLQNALLERPSNDSFDHVEIEAIYRPALDEAQIGGDFFDMYELEDHQIAFLIGDISGKGLTAATKTAEIKFTLRAFLHEHPSPSSAMLRLNEFICGTKNREEPDYSNFLCLSIGIFNTDTGQLAYCSAGSEAPLIYRSKQNTVEICGNQSNGMMLGIVPRIDYNSAIFMLEPGDLFVMSTDGITEARQSGHDLFGVDGIINSLKNCDKTASLLQIGEIIVNDALKHSGGTFKDDVCVLIARRI
jgi:PAS domain S-box-containing protein